MEQDKKYCIYKITDLRTDEIIYIGKTINFSGRKSGHFTQNKQYIDKYMYDEGRDNFEMSIIQDNIETNDEAVKIEDTYIVEYQPIMNKCRSGHIENDDPKEYQKQYYLEKWKNSDKYKEYLNNYYKSEKYIAKKREYYNTDKYREYMRQKGREYYSNMTDEQKAHKREYYRQWIAKQKQKKKLLQNNEQA